MNPWSDTATGSTGRRLAEIHIFLPGGKIGSKNKSKRRETEQKKKKHNFMHTEP
jgi:hypothetical protein